MTTHQCQCGPQGGTTILILTGAWVVFTQALHAAAITPGTLITWGSVLRLVTQSKPAFTNVSCGWSYSVASRSDGSIVGWGMNNYEQANPPLHLGNVIATATGHAQEGWTLAVRSNGTVVAWGANHRGQTNVPPGLNGVRAVAAGYGHSMALKNNGTAVAWGDNELGQTTIPPALSSVMQMAAGGYHSAALKSNGTVVVWGHNGVGQTNVPTGLTGVIAIAAGSGHTLALKNDGTVVSWGSETNVPADLDQVRGIAAGSGLSVALRADGTVVAWGYNSVGQATVPAGLSQPGAAMTLARPMFQPDSATSWPSPPEKITPRRSRQTAPSFRGAQVSMTNPACRRAWLTCRQSPPTASILLRCSATARCWPGATSLAVPPTSQRL